MIVIVIATFRGIVIVVAITTIPEETVIATAATTEIGKEDVMMMHPLVSQALAEITVADATTIRFVA